MSESDIDMDRCLLGIDDEKACVPEITWTNCAEQMSPDEMVVIVDHKDKFDIHRGCELWAQVVVYGDPHNYKYTEFTPEKWEELKND